jgi:hypothetical protein
LVAVDDSWRLKALVVGVTTTSCALLAFSWLAGLGPDILVERLRLRAHLGHTVELDAACPPDQEEEARMLLLRSSCNGRPARELF